MARQRRCFPATLLDKLGPSGTEVFLALQGVCSLRFPRRASAGAGLVIFPDSYPIVPPGHVESEPCSSG
jgi:hypothetical protein